MSTRLLMLMCGCVLSLALSGCQSPFKEKDEQQRKEEAGEVIRDQSGDTSFRAFSGLLRTAVAKRDREMLKSLMAPNFGYRWDAPPAGETPFDYWDQTNAWPELESLLKGNFVPSEQYMVTPPAFAKDPAYRGYRIGHRLMGGSWKFAYFIQGEDILP